MSFLKKLAKDGLNNVTQNAQSAANVARTKRGTTAPPRVSQTSQQARRTSSGRQSGITQSGNMLGGAFAALLGSADLIGSAQRLLDNVGGVSGEIFSACPVCQTAAIANTVCERCGTQVPSALAQNPTGMEANAAAQPARPTNCNNCGAAVQGAVCEYCDSRIL